MSTKTANWNGSDSSDIPELVIGKVTRELIGSHRGNFLEIPGRDGALYFPQNRGRRKITLECFIQSDTWPSGRRDAVTAVADWVDVGVQGRLMLSDEPLVYYEAVYMGPPNVDEWRDVGVFDLEFSVDPYAYDINLSQHSYSATASDTESVDLGLSVECYPIVDISPTNGTMTSLTFQTNGLQLLSWSGTIASGGHLQIDALRGLVYNGAWLDTEVTGAYTPVSTLLDMASVAGDFPVLLPNQLNELTFNALSGTATTFTITITYRKRYRK